MTPASGRRCGRLDGPHLSDAAVTDPAELTAMEASVTRVLAQHHSIATESREVHSFDAERAHACRKHSAASVHTPIPARGDFIVLQESRQ